jgi:hypothetical protein
VRQEVQHHFQGKLPELQGTIHSRLRFLLQTTSTRKRERKNRKSLEEYRRFQARVEAEDRVEKEEKLNFKGWEQRCRIDQKRFGGFYACNGCCKRLEDPLIESRCCEPEYVLRMDDELHCHDSPIWISPGKFRKPKWGETWVAGWGSENQWRCPTAAWEESTRHAVDLIYFKNEEDYQAWSKRRKQVLEDERITREKIHKEMMSNRPFRDRWPITSRCVAFILGILLIIAACAIWYLVMMLLKRVLMYFR